MRHSSTGSLASKPDCSTSSSSSRDRPLNDEGVPRRARLDVDRPSAAKPAPVTERQGDELRAVRACSGGDRSDRSSSAIGNAPRAFVNQALKSGSNLNYPETGPPETGPFGSSSDLK